MVLDWTIEVYGSRLAILWIIYHGKVIKKLYDLYGAIYDESMINLVRKPGPFFIKHFGSILEHFILTNDF